MEDTLYTVRIESGYNGQCLTTTDTFTHAARWVMRALTWLNHDVPTGARCDHRITYFGKVTI